MKELPFKNQYRQAFMPALGKVRTERRIRKILLYIIAADMIALPAVFVKLFLIPDHVAVVHAAGPDTSAANGPMHSGGSAPDSSAVSHLMDQLRSSGLDPKLVPVKPSHRTLHVGGRLVTMNSDNFQIFEYSTHDGAMSEGASLASAYKNSAKSAEWKSSIHIYVDDVLVIYYMGRSQTVITSLDQNGGLSLTQNSSALSTIMNVSN